MKYLVLLLSLSFIKCGSKSKKNVAKSFYDTSNYYIRDTEINSLANNLFMSNRLFFAINEGDFLDADTHNRHLIFLKEYFYSYKAVVFSLKLIDSNTCLASTAVLTSSKHLQLHDISIVYKNGFNLQKKSWMIQTDTAEAIWRRVDHFLNQKHEYNFDGVIDDNARGLLYHKDGEYYMLNDNYINRNAMDSLQSFFLNSVW